MTPILLQPPAEEPVALAEARAFVRLDDTAEDGLLAALVTSARVTVEAVSGLALVSQTWRFVLEAWPGAGVLRLPMAPVDSVLSVRGRDMAGAELAVPEGVVSPAATVERDALYFDRLAAPPRAVEVDVRLGFGGADDVPGPLRQAIRLLVAHWFENRGDEPVAHKPPLPPEVVALLAPWRRTRL